MATVEFGDAIEKINVNTRVGIFFDVTIKPDCFSQREAFELGNNLVEFINQAIETDDKNLFGGGNVQIRMAIGPVANQGDRIIGYSYMRRSIVPGGELDWYFTGDLGNGKKYDESELLSGIEYP